MNVRLVALCLLLPLAGLACGGGSSNAKDSAVAPPDSAAPAIDASAAQDGDLRDQASDLAGERKSVDASTANLDGPADGAPAVLVADASADGPGRTGDTGGTGGGAGGTSGGTGLSGSGNGSGSSGTGGTGGTGISCSSGSHDGGGGICMPMGSYAPGYHDGGNGVAAPLGTCRPSFHDGGDGVCVATGSYSPGFHDGGDGSAVALGSCKAGFHDNGAGICTAGKCLYWMHDGGDGTCMPSGACSLHYHLGKDGACVATIECPPGQHDGGDETCVASGACSAGFHDGGKGICVPTDQCVLGYKLNAGGVCEASLAGVHDGGDGSYLPFGFCSAGYHDDGRGTCVATGCSPGYAFVGECVPRFTSVSAGAKHTCAIKTDGTVACWGSDDGTMRVTSPPSGQFLSISAGGGGPRFDLSSNGHTCGLRPDGTLACWGTNARPTCSVSADGGYSCTGISWTANGTIAVKEDVTDGGQSTPPPGPFQSVSAGGCHTCAVKLDGTVACWGCNQTYRADALGQLKYEDVGQARPPTGTFSSVSAGTCHTCGVRTDGTVACWGCDDTVYYDSYAKMRVTVPGGQSSPPSGTFRSVSAGVDHTCGIRTDGTVACWGNDKNGAAYFINGAKASCGQTTPPQGTFASVSAGYGTTCGIKTDGTTVCWGCVKPESMPSGALSAFSVGGSHFCGVAADGALSCSGTTSSVHNSLAAFAPTNRVLSVAQGASQNLSNYVCTIRQGGSLACASYNRKRFAPAGSYIAVSGKAEPICALKDDGTLSCWSWSSSLSDFAASEAPSGSFLSVSAGQNYACAIRSDSTLACWGNNTYGQATPPGGTFSAVATYSRHSCGIKTDGLLTCWGDNNYGQAAAPSGTFLSVIVNDYVSCGIKTDGSSACWGSGASIMNSKNTGTSLGITMGNLWTLGTDGKMACRDAYAYQPGCPTGVFQSMVNGSGSVCAINAAGFPACWGVTGMTP